MFYEQKDEEPEGCRCLRSHVAQSTKEQTDGSLAHNTEEHKKTEVGSCDEGTSLTGAEGEEEEGVGPIQEERGDTMQQGQRWVSRVHEPQWYE